MMETIRIGASGKAVKIAQSLMGCRVSGEFDASFETELRRWQAEQGIAADGVLGKESWKALAGCAPICSKSRNRRHHAVYALQMLLENLDADGIFGSKTRSAVIAYQAAAGLEADGICGKKTWAALLTGERAAAKAFVQPADYKQGDSRWGKKMYSCCGNKKQTMANSGCGPTAMADIVATLVDGAVDPYDLAELSMANGHRSRSGGTAWSFFPFIQEKFGFGKMIETSSLATLKACLDEGGYAVCSMGPGYWTSGGHFICAWKYDDKYIYANDPASRTRKKQKQAAFLEQRKRFFCFCK